MMTEFKLYGSGGHITALLTAEQAKKADLGIGKLFLAPVGKLESGSMTGYYCNACKTEFGGPPSTHPEDGTDGPERVSENLLLVERGQYVCDRCSSTIGQYRVFAKNDEGADAGQAMPSTGRGA